MSRVHVRVRAPTRTKKHHPSPLLRAVAATWSGLTDHLPASSLLPPLIPVAVPIYLPPPAGLYTTSYSSSISNYRAPNQPPPFPHPSQCLPPYTTTPACSIHLGFSISNYTAPSHPTPLSLSTRRSAYPPPPQLYRVTSQPVSLPPSPFLPRPLSFLLPYGIT